MRLIKAGLVFFSALIILSSIQTVLAVPPLPAEYYGDIIIDGSPAPEGTTITAYIQDTVKGSITTIEPGKFGGSGLFDPRIKINVSEEENQTGNLLVRFLINGQQANQIIPFEPGTARKLAISAETHAEIITGQTLNPTPEQTIIAGYNLSPQEMINNPPQSQTPARQGLLNEMKYTSDDGIAELILKKDTVMLSPSGQSVQNITLKSRNINDLAVISDRTLLFSGYSYEISPERTYFNPDGMLRISVPLERITDLFAMNPQLYQYDSRTLSWNPVETGKNQFNGIISADVNEGAVYALFLTKTIQGSTSITPEMTQAIYSPDYPYYSSGNQFQQHLPPNSRISSQDIIYSQSAVILDNIKAVTTSDTIIPVTEQTINYITSANTSDNSEVITNVTQTNIIPVASKTQTNTSSSPFGTKMTFGSGSIIIVLIFLIIIANIVIYLIYTRWWQNRT